MEKLVLIEKLFDKESYTFFEYSSKEGALIKFKEIIKVNLKQAYENGILELDSDLSLTNKKSILGVKKTSPYDKFLGKVIISVSNYSIVTLDEFFESRKVSSYYTTTEDYI